MRFIVKCEVCGGEGPYFWPTAGRIVCHGCPDPSESASAPNETPTPEVQGARDWTEDFSHENGNYQNRCCRCNNVFIGHKRRVTCKLCAKPLPAPSDPTDGNEISERTCHYCGLNKCRCSYRSGRKGLHSVECSNISAQTTIGEMRKELDLLAGALGDDTPAVWKFSYTTIDPTGSRAAEKAGK